MIPGTQVLHKSRDVKEIHLIFFIYKKIKGNSFDIFREERELVMVIKKNEKYIDREFLVYRLIK
jgi:hypothetical protein